MILALQCRRDTKEYADVDAGRHVARADREGLRLVPEQPRLARPLRTYPHALASATPLLVRHCVQSLRSRFTFFFGTCGECYLNHLS